MERSRKIKIPIGASCEVYAHNCINMHSSYLNASTSNTRIAQETNVIRVAGPEFPVATSFGTARCASFSCLRIISGGDDLFI